MIALNSLPGDAWFSLLQYPANDAAQGRHSLLQLTYEGRQLTLRFAPDPDGASVAAAARFLPGCDIRVTKTSNMLAGQSNPSSCRVEGADGTVLALVKDFAVAANAIEIGDRIVWDGREYQVLTFGLDRQYREIGPYKQLYRIHTKEF